MAISVKEETPTELVVKRSALQERIGSSLLIVIGLFIVFFIGEKYELRCDRSVDSAQMCVVESRRFLSGRRVAYPASMLRRANLETGQSRSGEKTYFIMLDFMGRRVQLTNPVESARLEKERLANEINDFIRRSDSPRLKVEYGSRGTFLALGGGLIAAGVVLLLLTTHGRIRFSLPEDKVVYERKNLLGMTSEISFRVSDIVVAQMDYRRNMEGMSLYRAVLRLFGGEEVPLSFYFWGIGTEHEETMERIQALVRRSRQESSGVSSEVASQVEPAW